MEIKYSIQVSEEAIEKLFESIMFYEGIKPNLGDKFLEDYILTLNKLSSNPNYYFKISERYRRIKFSVFQTMLVYEINENRITVISVVDMRSKPNKKFY